MEGNLDDVWTPFSRPEMVIVLGSILSELIIVGFANQSHFPLVGRMVLRHQQCLGTRIQPKNELNNRVNMIGVFNLTDASPFPITDHRFRTLSLKYQFIFTSFQ